MTRSRTATELAFLAGRYDPDSRKRVSRPAKPWRRRQQNPRRTLLPEEKKAKLQKSYENAHRFQEYIEKCTGNVQGDAERGKELFPERSVEYIKQSIICHRMKPVNERAKNPWNAFLSIKAKEINDGEKSILSLPNASVRH